MCYKYRICLVILHLMVVTFAFPAMPRPDQPQHQEPEPVSSNFIPESEVVSKAIRSLLDESLEAEDETELTAPRESDENYDDYADYGQSNAAMQDLQSDNTATQNRDDNDEYLSRWLFGGTEEDSNDYY